MQHLSYDPHDPVFQFRNWKLSTQVITFANVYGLPLVDPEHDTGSMTISASSLTWAGGQRASSGSIEVRARIADDGESVEVNMSAAAPERIRCSKLILSGVSDGELIGHNWASSRITRSGTTMHYPGTVPMALVFIAHPDGSFSYFESLDDRVRAKRFAVFQRPDGVTVELIHEDAATTMRSSTEVPAWRFGRTEDPEGIVRRHTERAARSFGLDPWDARDDVPAWMRDVSLVVSLHGMHWSGRVFLTYAEMTSALDYIAARIEGRRVLAFLPGWEGRYYWQYGDYRPEPLLGGADGFARLADRARQLGIHLMPMFGANCANRNLPGFDEWGAPAEMRAASGMSFYGNRPDWDVSRSHDPGWQAWLNPGAPMWRHHLVEQVTTLIRTFDLPAVFLDTQEVWINDPRWDLYPGLVTLRDELRGRCHGLLMAGEGWYDALGAVTPLSQYNQPARWADLVFAPHNRHFLHLSTGDPSRGSTGVHELGFNAFALPPDRPWVIPTLTIVDGTLTDGREGADAVIGMAKAYASKYL